MNARRPMCLLLRLALPLIAAGALGGPAASGVGLTIVWSRAGAVL